MSSTAGTKRPHPGGSGQSNKRQRKADPSRAKYRAQAANASGRASIGQNVIQAGDVGLFVTSDKGKEKSALREVEDLLEGYLEDGVNEASSREHGDGMLHNIGEGGRGEHGEDQEERGTEAGKNAADRGSSGTGGRSIEDDIAAELNELKGESHPSSHASTGSQTNGGRTGSSPNTSSKIALITLDIPCVSFIRFPTTTTLNPTSIILDILRKAATHPDQQRSRFVKRLTPITTVRKVLNQGLDEISNEILPAHFSLAPSADPDALFGKSQSPPAEGASTGEANVGNSLEGTTRQRHCRFKIDVTRRQSDHLSREEVIQTVASHVTRVGHGQHTVDLKTWEKLILVEVYRGIVGMSVIDIGYEEWEGRLKRGNLAEVYAAARQRQEEERSHKLHEKVGA